MKTRFYKFFLGLGLFGLLVGYGLFSVNVSAQSPALFSWQIDVIDSANFVGQFPSLALHPETEAPYISYYDSSTTDLKLAFPVPSGGDCGPENSWSCNSLAFQNNLDYGGFSSLVFNSLGQWGIAYSNFSNGVNAFRGIPAPGGTELFWSDIEIPGNTSFLNSAGLDMNETVHVSYAAIDFQTSDGYIKHAKYVGFGGNCGDGNWNCENVVQTSLLGFGMYNSLFFILNLPSIAYRDINQHLSVATFIGYAGGNCGPDDSWICWVLDGTTNVGGIISSDIEGDSSLGITYIGTDHVLHFAEYVSTGGNCGTGIYLNAFQCITIETVGSPASGQIMGASVDMSTGSPIIAYNNTDDQGNSILKIAYRKFAGNCGPLAGFFRTWQCDVVDLGEDTNDVGYYPSLKVNSAGVVNIAYFDFTAGDLKFAVSDVAIYPTPTPSPTPTFAIDFYLPFIKK